MITLLNSDNNNMFEQLKIQKETAFQPPPSPSNPNKLQQYFESSSFLLQQDELLLFIKDLPIINLKEIKSVNTLISLLIKQNQMVGNKCQQQIGLIKQEYAKHDKLIRANKQMKIQRDKLDKEKRQIEEAFTKFKYSSQKQNNRQQDYQMKERKLEAESMKINALFKEANQKITKYEELFCSLCAQDFKKCDELIKSSIQGELQQSLEDYCLNQRKKYKYFTKVKGVVQQFCMRLQKISKVVSPSVLTAQLSTQTSSMMDLIAELCDHEKNKKKKKKTEGSQRNTIHTSENRIGNERNVGFFQGMIQKLIESSENNSTSKQSIALELEELKNSLQQTKSYYENIVRNLKEQYTGKDEEIQKRFHLKEQTIKYYEEELDKFRESNKSLKYEVEELNSEVCNYKKQIEQKSRLIAAQSEQIQQLENNGKNEIEQIKKDTQLRIEQLKKMAVLKIEQREQIIKQFNERRKKQQQEHEAEMSELKFKIKLSQQQCQQKQKDLKVQAKNIAAIETQNQRMESIGKQLVANAQKYKKQAIELEQKMSRKTKQGDEFKETLSSLQHEKTLQAAYINELQTKNQTLNNKIKSLQTKAKNEATNKKQITAMKNTIVEQKQRNEQFEAYCGQLKEQNQRLKTVVKEMKKELEDVYVRLSELKHIEAQRERLYLEAQNSERVRDGLAKEHEELKFEMLKLEAENKKMQLELKHFRNIVSRMKILQQE